MNFVVKGNIVDIENKSIDYATIRVGEGKIISVDKIESQKEEAPFILPGFIDAHVHIESSMLVPSEFAKLAVIHGTVATVSDPHEIANVCGMKGVEYMIENGKQVPFKFYFSDNETSPQPLSEGEGLDAFTVKRFTRIIPFIN